MTPICGHCGLFCRPADEYTDFGCPGDMEPPESILLCAKCSKIAEDKIVAETVRPMRPYIPWLPGKFHRNAIRRLGMVLAGPNMAAWCEAFWPDAIPNGYKVWSNTQ